MLPRRRLPEGAHDAVEQVEGEASKRPRIVGRPVEPVGQLSQVALVARRRQQVIGEPVAELRKEAAMPRNAGAGDEVRRVGRREELCQRGAEPVAGLAGRLYRIQQRGQRTALPRALGPRTHGMNERGERSARAAVSAADTNA